MNSGREGTLRTVLIVDAAEPRKSRREGGAGRSADRRRADDEPRSVGTLIAGARSRRINV